MSKLNISLAAALALFAATAGVARANPIPTTTDEARALAGKATSHLYVDDAAPTNVAVTTTDQARSEAGRLLPAASGAWVTPMLAKDDDEGRAAAFGGQDVPSENDSLAVSPAVTGTTDGRN